MTVIESPPSPRTPVRGGGGLPRIAFFSAEWCAGDHINLGGSDYWRCGLPAAKLYENDWDIVFARNLAEGADGDPRIYCQTPSGDWIDDRDIIVLQRWMGEGTADRIRRAREAGQIIINDVDDDYWRMPEGHVSRNTVDPEFRKEANKEHYRAAVAASSLITVSSQYLADELSGWGPPVKLVRNYIDGATWPPYPTGDYIGWVGGLPWRGKDLEILSDTVIPWMREHKLFFYHGGAIPAVKIEDRLGYNRVTTRPLCNIHNYPRLWEPLRVALIPIADTPFGRAKSWVKGLEACARGIPFIHSPHTEYEALGVGLCAHEPTDWVRYLEALEDPDFYQEQAAKNRARAIDLDIGTHWHEWASLFKSIARGENRATASTATAT